MDHPLDHNPGDKVPVFFIIGRPRSGTTLLRMLFEAHPQVLVPPECPFVINLYKKYGKVTRWDESTIRAFADDLARQRYFDKWLIGKDSLESRLMKASGESTFQDIFREVCRSYTSIYEKEEIRFIGDKNPAYSLFIRRIHKLFPDAKFVHITRDYRDNYLSLVKVNFEVPIVPLVVFRWKFSIRQAQKLKKQIPEQVYPIRYEDLVADPEKQFGSLCRFLGIPYDPGVMSFYRKKEATEKAYEGSEDLEKVHQSLFNPISTARTGLWKSEMKPRDVRIADLVAGKTAGRMGYHREYPSFNPFLYLWILPTLVYASAMYRLILLGDHLPYRMRNGLNHALGIFLRAYWKFNKRKVKPL
jgi:hypothetical protein